MEKGRIIRSFGLTKNGSGFSLGMNLKRIVGLFLLAGSLLGGDELSGEVIERAEYQLRWGLFSVGTVVMEMREGGEPGEEVYFMRAETNSWMDRFLKARTMIWSTYDREAERSLHFRREERDKPVPDVNEAKFDWETGTVRFVKNGEVRLPVGIREGTQDPLSVVFAARREKLAAGRTFTLPVTDGKTFAVADFRVRDGGKRANGTGDRVETFEVVVDMKDVRGVFARPDGALIRVWVEQEPPHLPVRLKSEIVLGSFVAEIRARADR